MTQDNGYGEFEVADGSKAKAPIAGSPLEALRQEMRRAVAREPITLRVPERKNVALIFDTNIEFGVIAKWNRSSQKMGDLGQMNFATLVIAGQMRGIVFNGQEVTDEDGVSIRFSSPLFRDLLGISETATRIETIRALYGLDGHITATSGEILTAAGFGDGVDLEDENPTK